jgi:hypothetical protein
MTVKEKAVRAWQKVEPCVDQESFVRGYTLGYWDSVVDHEPEIAEGTRAIAQVSNREGNPA